MNSGAPSLHAGITTISAFCLNAYPNLGATSASQKPFWED